jgi:hypothetical protein
MKLIAILLSLSLAPWLSIHQPSHKLVIFTGSDWCPNCKQLDKTILNDSVFIKYASDKQIQIEIVDFPQRAIQSDSLKQANVKSAEFFNFNGQFPGIYLLSLKDSSIIKIDYNHESPEAFCKVLAN